jgi:transcription initiation factor TFIIIB Brf1 subunit/transcription initiation factor TFIIB
MTNTECLHDVRFEITDDHSGDIICTNCGLVKSVLYLFNNVKHQDNVICSLKQRDVNRRDYNEIENIVELLHLPNYLSTIITNDYEKNYKHKKFHSEASKMSSCIYSNINLNGNCIAIKDIVKVSGVNPKYIIPKNNPVIIQDLIQMSEKYMSLLEIPFNIQSLIKAKLSTFSNTGHNPLTVIASIVYNICKRNKLRLSMQKISGIVGISIISIQRFVKKYHDSIS